ncbi:MAG: glycosyltransferase [Caulobacter sp.]|nr:glycosyltransferase [Caulobacter sp.]
MEVVNYVIYRDNPYHQLLYSALDGRYTAVRGDIDLATEQLTRDGRQIFHVHWEEHALRPCSTTVEARAVKDFLLTQIARFKGLGGRVVWTVHNVMPHELEHADVFLDLRRGLADIADLILVHNVEAVGLLQEQVSLDICKVVHLAHPSYQGIYPSARSGPEARGDLPAGRLLAFVKVRRYKGFDGLLDMLPDRFLAENDLTLQITGQPLAGDGFSDELLVRANGRARVDLDFRVVPDEEVITLLRSATCVVLPYERFLTSGVSLLCLTAGALVVAPRVAALEEVFPASCHRLLYRPGDAEDLRRAVLEANSLSPEEREGMTADSLARADWLSPKRISTRLGRLYDELLYQGGKPLGEPAVIPEIAGLDPGAAD